MMSSPPFSLPESTSEMARQLVAFPWADTPLGDARHWPLAIRSLLATWLDSPQPMCFVWGDAHYFFFNDAYRPFLGLRADWAMGRPFREVWPDVWADVEPLLNLALAGQGVRRENLPLTMTRNGYAEQTWWTFTYMPLRDETGRILGMMCTTIDVTQSVLNEQAQRELQATLEQRVQERTAALMQIQEDLRHSQKMEAVGQLTGGLAHDFNNLLTGITGSLELMRRKSRSGRLDTPNLERYIGIAQGAAERAASLTSRLLAFARRQTLDARPTDVAQLIANMEELIQRSVGPGIKLQIDTQDNLWPVRVDTGLLDNALLNLCINARDAMPDGGSLVVRAQNAVVADGLAESLSLMPGDYVCLSVTDTGVGMSQSVAARAFEPFYTTKPLGEGTGLGLSMVYGFVQQSGGQLRIDSELGCGTTMSIHLPRHIGTLEGEVQPRDCDAMTPVSAQAQVLVVDDEPSVRALVVEVLQDMGIGTVQACDGQSALTLLQDRRDLDLMITDVGLPGGLNGRQLADAARALHPGLNVLFITGYADQVLAVDGVVESGMHILTKPFELQALAEKVRMLT